MSDRPPPWWDLKRTQVMINGWGPDYLAPGSFLGP